MDKITYYIVIAISKLPLRILYCLADLLFFLNHYFIGYRKKIILENLTRSFPEKSLTEIKAIHKKFNRNFSDYLFESVKALTADDKQMEHRMDSLNHELINDYYNKGTNIMLLTGHSFNFEWTTFLAKKLLIEKFYFIYKPLRNKLMNDQALRLRAKSKAEGIPMKETYKRISQIPNTGQYAYYFLADQSPKGVENKNWITFLNQDTAVFSGFETIAIKYQLKVFYGEFIKVSRGNYRLQVKEIIPENGEYFIQNELIKSFYKNLEQTIYADPANWLWSHKRWKHKRSTE